ncbi:MAG: hypothetical protein Roseis2KO_46380 [Roseivirga sp.]
MMKLRHITIIFILALFSSACQDLKDQEMIVNLVNAAMEGSENKEDKTLLVVSSADCGTCFVTELSQFLSRETLDATLIVSFEESKGKELDQKVKDLLVANAIPVFEMHSLDLLVEIGKYSGSPQSPYILRYGGQKLEIESLVQH